MARVLIKDLTKHEGQTVRLAGWVQTIRDQGSLCFIILRDVSGLAQIVVTKQATETFTVATGLALESVVAIDGLVKQETQAPGGWELAATKIEVLSAADPLLPIPIYAKDEHETDQNVRLDWRWLDLRKPKKRLIFQVWTVLEAAYRHYWLTNGYLEIHSPKLMSSPSESGAELFEVKYFDRKAYLAQSPQFYKQMAMAAGFEKVFEIGPLFRAEPSFTTRHATEFTGYDAEISFIDSHEDVMVAHEGVIAQAIKALKEQLGDPVKQSFNQEITVPTTPFPRLALAEVKKRLAVAGVPSEREGDLSPEEERQLSQLVNKEFNHDFVFVTDYPTTVRPFYHQRHQNNPQLTKSFDLLYRGLEITTGAQREHRYATLVAQAQEKGLSLEPIQYYLNFFKYGCPPHGGYGHGPERLIMKLLDLESIREVAFLYRGVKRLTP